MVESVEISERGVCRWCMKSGVISFVPLKTDFKDPRVNRYNKESNARAMTDKLIKIADGVYACRACVSAYRLKTTEN